MVCVVLIASTWVLCFWLHGLFGRYSVHMSTVLLVIWSVCSLLGPHGYGAVGYMVCVFFIGSTWVLCFWLHGLFGLYSVHMGTVLLVTWSIWSLFGPHGYCAFGPGFPFTPSAACSTRVRLGVLCLCFLRHSQQQRARCPSLEALAFPEPQTFHFQTPSRRLQPDGLLFALRPHRLQRR